MSYPTSSSVSNPFYGSISGTSRLQGNSAARSLTSAKQIAPEVKSGAVFSLLLRNEAISSSHSEKVIERLAKMVELKPDTLKSELKTMETDPDPKVRQLAKAVSYAVEKPLYLSPRNQSTDRVIYESNGSAYYSLDKNAFGYDQVSHYSEPADAINSAYSEPQRQLATVMSSYPIKGDKVIPNGDSTPPQPIGFPPSRPVSRR